MAGWLNVLLQRLYVAIDRYMQTTTADERSIKSFYHFCTSESTYPDVFVCDGYRLCRSAKLLMSLGYGNFSAVVQYDVFAMAMSFLQSGKSWSLTEFKSSEFALNLTKFESSSILNSPNLSILLLLAYHKICNDHYRNEKWQTFEPWTCNIDYVSPTDNMNAKSFIDSRAFTSELTSIIDLENSNLPMDYFTSVLPRAQYGDESAAVLSLGTASGSATLKGETDSDFGKWTKSDGTLS